MGKLLEIITKEIMVILIAAMPLMELKGAIPIGVSLGLSPIHATILGVLGSLIPVPFLLFLLKPIFIMLRKTILFKDTIDKIVKKTIKKGERVERYHILGLMMLVAMPLPGTGVWTGCLAAIIFNIKFKPAFFAIITGNIIAGLIMFTLSYIVVNI